ncbi:hypothetical protein Droror1_Dr00000405 [Drosera rotundifolia]
MHGKVTEKIDVYAYGIILLELLSGRKPFDNRTPKGPQSLVVWILKLLQGDVKVTTWAKQQVEGSTVVDTETFEGKTTPRDIQSILNATFLDMEDDSISISSSEKNISLEEYLQGRWSRSASFH